jgi:putative acetyltransferase
MKIRPEKNDDILAIRKINEQAFKQQGEANIVDEMRQCCPEKIALVACEGELIIGYILFTPVVIKTDNESEIKGMGLVPLAVLPEFQNQGIGSELVKAGLTAMREIKTPFVVVLGHPEYYPRFGFVPSSYYGIRSEYANIPEDVFMIYVINETCLKNIKGVAHYRQEWSQLD